MSDTEMIILENINGIAKVTDYYSYSEVIPTQVTSGTLTLISSTIDKSGISATFSRALKTGKSTDTDISINFVTVLGFAYLTKSKGFTKHNTEGHGTLTFGQTNATSSFISGGGSSDDFFQDHGVYMTIMWVGLAQLSIFVMRYFKWWSFSSLVHALLGTVVLIISLWSAFEAYKKNKTSLAGLGADKTLRYHSRLAFTICATCMAQFLLGIITKYYLMFKSKLRIVMLVRRLHQIIGWFMPMMALINIKYGWVLQSKQSTLDDIVYPCYGVLVFIIAILEIRHRWGNRINYALMKWRTHKLDGFMGELTRSVSQGMDSLLIMTEGKRHIEILNEISLHNRKWMFYDEHILDVSGFRWNHPGGNLLFDMVYGQDAGKFINGCSSVNDDVEAYTHSYTARNLINFLKIGKLAYPTGVLINRIPTERMSSMDWTLTNNTKISTTVHCLEFSSDAWDIAEEAPGYEWMGKHFLVSSKVKEKRISRYYSLTLVNLAVWADQVRKVGGSVRNYNMDRTQGRLRLYVKCYEKGKLSPVICDLKVGDELHFKGPLGPGLCMVSIIEEDYIAFAAGTGILPFLDLVYSIWQGRATKIKLHLYITFRTNRESFALDLIEATAAKFPKNLKVYIRVEGNLPQMNQEILNKWVVVPTVHKVWICGPSGFNKKFRDLMLSQHFSAGKIILL